MDDGAKVGSPAGVETAPELSRPASQDGPLMYEQSAFSANSLPDAVDAANREVDERTRVSAYARLDFEEFTFYVQTLQVVLGRRAQNGQNMVDVHLGSSKAISRQHAKIFYNFATQRFELTVMGRNGAFVNSDFVQHEATVPLRDKMEVKIGTIGFKFVLPNSPKHEARLDPDATELPDSPDENENNFFAVEEKKRPKKKAVPSEPKPEKPKKREYTLEEIPVEYREKPQLSYSVLITRALQERAPDNGLSLADIYEAIMDLFPYYRYCPSGWQNSVRHNLSSSKAFRKVSKEGKGWLWGLDTEYINEKDKKRAHAKQRRASNSQPDKSIAELAQEIPSRKMSESKPRTESGNLLSPQLIRLLSRLQSQLQGHLAKAGGKTLNAQMLSNALAVVVARAAKSAGGIEQLEKFLQSPQQVNLILVQALELIKYQTTRRPSEVQHEVKQELRELKQGMGGMEPVFEEDEGSGTGTTPGPSGTPGPSTPGPSAPVIPQPASQAVPVIGAEVKTEVEPLPEQVQGSQAQVAHAVPSQVQTQTVPQAQPVPAQPVLGQPMPAQPVPAQPVPGQPMPAQPMPAQPIPQTAPPQAVQAQPVQAQPAPSAPSAAPSAPSAAPTAPPPAPAPAPSARKYSPEQIAHLLAQAEKVPNPSPSILAAIEQLRAHQRAMLKRPAPGDDPAPKRPTTEAA